MVVVASLDMYGGFGALQLCGTAGHAEAFFSDTFYAFKAQLQAFVAFLRTGQRPFPFSETQELMKLVIAGTRSRDENGREVRLDEISSERCMLDAGARLRGHEPRDAHLHRARSQATDG